MHRTSILARAGCVALLAVAGSAALASAAPRPPFAIHKTVNKSRVTPGENVMYTIKIRNNTDQSQQIQSIFDGLPKGFTYVAGSTQGLTNADPVMGPHRLRWDGPFRIPAHTSQVLKLKATAGGCGTGSGDMVVVYNHAAAKTVGYIKTGPTAPVKVNCS